MSGATGTGTSAGTGPLQGLTVGVTAARKAEELVAALGHGEILARGPKARGAIRGAGLTDAWSPDPESSTEVLEHLLDRGVAGLRIALQLHGDPLTGLVEALSAAGAEVVTVPVYRWELPADLGPVDRLTDRLLGGGLDAVTFTSAPAVGGLLRRAAERDLRDRVLDALRRSLVACVGPVTAAPLEAHGVPTVQPDRARLGPMVRALEAAVAARP